MPILPLRGSLAALVIAAACTGGPSSTADGPDAEGSPRDAAALRDRDGFRPLVGAGLRVSAPELDLGVVEIGQHGTAQLQLVNTRRLPVRLEPRTVTAGFAVDDDCGTVLRARASCTINVTFSPDHLGDIPGVLTIASAFHHRQEIALDGSGARRVTVSLSGPGAGQITSSPPGIDCGTTCSALFTDEVTLTATTADGNRFVGWSAPCTADAACTLPADTASVTATFEPSDTRRIAVTVAGGGPGFVYINDFDSGPLTLCPQPCTAFVPAGHSVQLLGFTPSTFGGWTGCPVLSSDPNACDLGTVTSDVSATVTFQRDEREVATLFPPLPVLGLAFTPGGDLLIADRAGVTEMTLSGSVVWSTAVPGGAHDIVTDAAGHIYGSSTRIPFQTTGGAGLFALDRNGTLLWTRDIPVAPNVSTSFQSTVAASPDGTVIAAHLADGAQVVDGSGADRFTVHGLSADGMAVAPDGTVAIGKAAAIEPEVAAARFTASGTPLPDIAEIPGDRSVSLTYDASNALCSMTTVGGFAHTSRILSDTSIAFTTSERTPDFGIPAPAGVAVDSLGELVAARALVDDTATGLHLEVFSPTGAITWTHDKGTQERLFDIVNDGVTLGALATDANHHVAVGGAYNLFTPWIQVYAMP